MMKIIVEINFMLISRNSKDKEKQKLFCFCTDFKFANVGCVGVIFLCERHHTNLYGTLFVGNEWWAVRGACKYNDLIFS